MIGDPAICAACRRLRMGDDRPKCAAFPDGIPDEIWLSGFDHRQPFPGDNGTRFVRHPDRPMPDGFAEDADPPESVFVTRLDHKVKHRSDKELREDAAAIIESFRNRPT